MKKIAERQQDILSIISKLDISPTMYKNAVEKYKAIAQFLEDLGISASIYPQGSFALGTVVRPYVKNDDANYDLDFICQVNGSRDEYTPSGLRQKIQDALQSSPIYRERLKVWDECFTIQYADISGVGFSIDIVPASDETVENKMRLHSYGDPHNLVGTAIAIPKYNGIRNYSWMTNNPKGYRTWFEQINRPFQQYSRNLYRQRLFSQYPTFFASVEDIPEDLERSALQRAIQILKHHRDVHYSHLSNGDHLKPISAIISTVAACIAFNCSPTTDTFTLLGCIIDELEVYSQLMTYSQNQFEYLHPGKTIIQKNNGQWHINNPANPADNLANKWNQSPKVAETFFRWIKTFKMDLMQSLTDEDDNGFRIALENSFGSRAVSTAIGSKYRPSITSSASVISTAAKPYFKVI